MKNDSNITCPFCNNNKILKKMACKKENKYFLILWCKNCGYGWQHPYPSDEELDKLYKNQGLYHEVIVDETQGGFLKRIKKINKFKPEKGNILDIGSGMGHFLMHAKNSAWVVDGVEPRLSASDYCYKKFGIKVFNGLFEEWSPNKKFDVITLWDVLEHVRDPFDLLNKSINMLSPGGLIVMSIPNASGLPARFFKGNWRYAMRPHINYFTMTFINKVLTQKHIEILRMDHSIKAQSIFEGIISMVPKNINVENAYKMTYSSGENNVKLTVGKDLKKINKKINI